MKYSVDTNVLSELTKPAPSPLVVDWLRRHETESAISSIVLGELRFGILLLPAGRKRTKLVRWFEEGVERFPVIDFDGDTASVWAALLAKLRHSGSAMPIKDSLIAASAKRHNLMVATRNVADFQRASVKIVNPFAAKSP
ncbi:type II toxin-antitoxin system VapC family toxin [Botrimarina mediterranea]|uniref:type II toxin-antitoxin system VapC family toxin n=1 Tax=Botrimarina mediterranea TaxID=2528022 RepID=UPI00118B54D2|nr:Toxin FitB [Planctomycetes bacterium K2D]